MLTKEMLDEITTKLVETYKPAEIYLFGSHARGLAASDSDIDLAVVLSTMTEPRHKLLARGLRALFDLEVGKDLVLYQQDEFQQLKNEKTSFAYQIVKMGKQIYAKTDA